MNMTSEVNQYGLAAEFHFSNEAGFCVFQNLKISSKRMRSDE